MKNKGKTPRSVFSAFSGDNVSFAGEFFEGAELTAVFGGIKCDLRGAIINDDCAISYTAVFGGIDIIVPEGVNVKVNSTSIFGGASNKTSKTPNAPTLYVSGLCMFGGVDVK